MVTTPHRTTSILQRLTTVGVGVAATLGLQAIAALLAPPAAQAQYIITLPDGARCEGQFRGYTGNGICQYPDGYYRGDILNGRRHGNGVFYYYDTETSNEDFQTIYDGEFRDGLPHGKGKFVYGNDNRYQGDVRNGLPNGTGLFIFRTSPPTETTEAIPDEPYLERLEWEQPEYANRYYGSVVNGLPSGRGSMVYGKCRNYNGDLRCSRYDGLFRNGVPHGRGTYTHDVCVRRNGQVQCIRFSGNFWAGQPNGNGTLSFPNGTTCQGQFNDFTLSGDGSCSYGNGDRYTGELRRGVPHGIGRMRYADGRVYSGEFQIGRPAPRVISEPESPEVEGGPPRLPN